MIKKLFRYTVIALVTCLVLAAFIGLGPGLWNRWVTYPDLEREVQALEERRREPPSLTPLHTFRGLLHAHSYWSHDSEGTLARILPAARKAEIDFIFLTDHPHGNRDTFPRGYHGNYDGVLIEAGGEKKGLCVWPLNSGVIDWDVDVDSVVKNVAEQGGMVFYAHSEEDHHWNNPWYHGMEVYNIHTDTKDEKLLPLILNLMVNGDAYRHWAMREVFDEQTAILGRWDSLNLHRKIVGFSAVDAHENQNLRARILKDGRVEWVGPNADPIDTVQLSFMNRWMFSEPDEEGWIFKWMIDTYESSFNYVTNYVIADTLSSASIANHVKRGNLFFAFKSLGDAKGFMLVSENADGTVTGLPGDSVLMKDVRSFRAVSPLPGQVRLIRNGEVIDVSPVGVHDYRWNGPVERGVYRVEVHLELSGSTVPWVYTNPIYVYN